MIPNEFSFKRKYFIKDLLTPESFIKNSSIVEFDDFDDFVDVYLNEQLFNKNSVDKIIIPIKDKIEIELLNTINSNVLPFSIIRLDNISHEVLDSFINYSRKAILINSNKIDELKTELINNPSEKFCKFCSNSYGYFRDEISYSNYINFVNIYTEPFLKFPYFCTADIKWNYSSFENMKLNELDAIQYFGSLIHNNMIKRSVEFNLKDYGFDFERKYEYDLMHMSSPKRLYIKGNNLYIDEPNELTKIDMELISKLDPNIESHYNIDELRHPYDTILTSESTHIKEISLVRILENIKINKNPNMIPYLAYFVSRALNGDNL